ncbi:MAG: alkaline phosphatase PhoX [Verrucomicrobiota bacterium]
MITRRSFIGTTGLAFLGLQRYAGAEPATRLIEPFGPLLADPAGVIDLPEGFTYRILSRRGEIMADGFKTPGQPDGMAAFPAADGKIVLVRNHELALKSVADGPFPDNSLIPEGVQSFDGGPDGKKPHLGGTTNLVFDPKSGKTVSQFLSLTGTDRNCAGGPMPWGSWITCEEPEDLTSERGKGHGWCFEVKATNGGGLQQPVPLKALGRFRHEAVALDPGTGMLYLTEDRTDGLLYRFIPTVKGDLSRGKLQALAISGKPSADLRNYQRESKWPVESEPLSAEWIDLDDVESPRDDLRIRGHKAGAARFARGEGIHWVDGVFYICCTDGGPSRRGQIFKLEPKADGNDVLELFLQPEKSDLLTNGDNLCPAPWGGIVICEDLIDASFSPAAHVRCVTPEGKIFTLAKNRKNGEFAGGCFSPDGKWFFVNLMGQGLTVAITGPWEKA